MVDDEDACRIKYRDIIERDTNFDVILAENENDALEKVERFQPKVVVTDLYMPKENTDNNIVIDGNEEDEIGVVLFYLKI